jgi:hypothetical protein
MKIKQKIEEKKFLSAKKRRQSGRDYNFRGDYKFRAHCILPHLNFRFIFSLSSFFVHISLFLVPV